MRWLRAVETQLLEQRGHLFHWVPVMLGIGIGLYFAGKAEPSARALLMALGLAATAPYLARRAGAAFGPLLLALALVAGGYAMAAIEARLATAPVLRGHYYGPVEGRIVDISRSQGDALRLMLDQVVLDNRSPARTPRRVRVSLYGPQDWLLAEPGARVMMTAHLGPPPAPAEPGGFDFRRYAWFRQLGAVGYVRAPVLMLEQPRDGTELWFARLQTRLSARIAGQIGGQAGALAAVILTGDRSRLDRVTQTEMRAANLTHIISISGLHMALLTGVVFGAVRGGIALVPPLALRAPAQKIGAVAALAAGGFYLLLSGHEVPAFRAFVMVAVMYIAVLAGRRAISLRAVALAAVLILCKDPQALTEPGFQMSFAATIALVAGFRAFAPKLRGLPRFWRPVVATVASSALAGTATAPFAAATFNMVAHYGLVANLLTVALVGSIVMPMGVLAFCLMPLGLEGPALWIVGKGLAFVLGVSHVVAGLPHAIGAVKSPMAAVVPVLALGLLMLVNWQGRLRFTGVAVAALAVVLWWFSPRPAILIAESGGLVGVMTTEGRALSKATGDGFAADNWLGADGGGMDQAGAAALWPDDGMADVGGQRLRIVTGKTRIAALSGCGGADVLVSNVEAATGRDCVVWDAPKLAQTGAVAGWLGSQGLRWQTVSATVGNRLWAQ